MTERWLSGMILDLRVPMDGKYMPTQASNAKKEATRAARLLPPYSAATPMETAATAVIAAVLVSTFTLRDWRAPDIGRDKKVRCKGQHGATSIVRSGKKYMKVTERHLSQLAPYTKKKDTRKE